MQDRLKYRIFDKKHKVMHYSDFVITSTGFVAEVIETKGEFCILKQTNLDFGKDKVVMQCTGVKDKNGALIYEGDIFKIPESDDEIIYRYVVWNDEKAKFGIFTKFVWEDDLFYPNGVEVTDEIEDFDYYYIENFEVIGNIYENPERLDGVPA